jgi:hypothetical protein
MTVHSVSNSVRRTTKARALLRPIFEKFTQGSDTVDLKAAEEVLGGLRWPVPTRR